MNLALDLAAKTGGLALHLGAEGRHLVGDLSTPDCGQEVFYYENGNKTPKLSVAHLLIQTSPRKLRQ